jgi:hypothetical protein
MRGGGVKRKNYKRACKFFRVANNSSGRVGHWVGISLAGAYPR